MQTWRFWLLVAFTVTLLTYAIISFKRRPFTYLQQEIKEIHLGDIEFDFQTGLYFHKEGKTVNLRGSMPDSHELGGHPSHCAVYNASKYLCASWYPKVKLEVDNIVEEHARCQVLTWTPLFENYKPHTCFSLSDFTWYGGSLLHQQTWPLNKAEVPLQGYVPHDLHSYKGKSNTFGNVIDWFWINSAGVAVIVDNSLPVDVSINHSGDKLMCFHSTSEHVKPVLKYTICKASNIRKVHRYVIKKYVHLPLKLPSDNYFLNSFWSTNPVFKNTLDQRNLLNYSQQVSEYGFQNSFININDDSLGLYKSDPFDKIKFPNSQQALMYLREYKLEIVLPLSPFVDLKENIQKDKLIHHHGDELLVTKVKGKEVNIINLLDDKVTEWYIDQLQELKKFFGFSGLNLVNEVSNLYDLTRLINIKDSEKNSRRFASIGEKMDVTILSNFALKSQQSGFFIQLSGPVSSWDNKGGLQSLIPSVLTLGILGYPFAIPNFIGGVGTLKAVNSSYSERIKPERELYIRWMGVAAYMPCMMFSYPPWLYDEEVVTMAKQFTKQHKEIVAPLAIKATREFEHVGQYIIIIYRGYSSFFYEYGIYFHYVV